ncbi:MAG: DUF1501 domain-containing protein, partial [Pirellulaceae bacterium]
SPQPLSTMHPSDQLARRQFFTSSASGLGMLALASLLQRDGLLAGENLGDSAGASPLAPKTPHFAPRAKSCIFFLPEGAPSHLDLFDPKPKLQELHGQKLPDSMTEKVRFAFIKKETAVLWGSKRKFTKHGQCGMELSDFLPHLGSIADDVCLVRSMHTDAFNHHPAQLMLMSGVPRFGRPSMGSWLTYGLGSESENLPGYVVLTAGRGGSGGVSNWTSGFLPSSYQGVLFRDRGDPVLNLANPPGVTPEMQQQGLSGIASLNRRRMEALQDPEIASRIASYELAFRMQSAAPELVDLSQESQATLDMYGVDRPEPTDLKGGRGGGKDVYKQFARNCLLARRLVERGVRFVTMVHASWDHHSNLDEELGYCARMADQPLVALVKDLKQRGLLDSTLLVFAGEFGRTPLAENRGGVMQSPTKVGRDHHPFAYSLWMAGGGFQGGLTHGQTDELGWSVTENPVHINDLHATILHQFGFDHHRLAIDYKGLSVRLTDQGGKVVNDLLV